VKKLIAKRLLRQPLERWFFTVITKSYKFLLFLPEFAGIYITCLLDIKCLLLVIL